MSRKSMQSWRRRDSGPNKGFNRTHKQRRCAVRYCSRNVSAPRKFKFNINPNSLSAGCELWVCGSAAIYYMMPSYLQQA
jgi:hypothetical protein